jgi:hypothetical protein
MTFPISETSSTTTPETFTSGQHEPVPELITPYELFPKEITGPTVWKREEFIQDTSRWQYRWSAEQITELEKSYETFLASGLDLPSINKVSSTKVDSYEFS